MPNQTKASPNPSKEGKKENKASPTTSLLRNKEERKPHPQPLPEEGGE